MIAKDNREVNRSRKLGRGLFCSRSCAANHGNDERRSVVVFLDCLCGKRFKTSTRCRARKHCSRVCASRFSVTDVRLVASREAGRKSGNLLKPHQTLAIREKWKYRLLGEYLQGRSHQFEYPVGNHVFDLVLLDTKVLVEFDSRYHSSRAQKKVDLLKDQVGKDNGFRVVRVATGENELISPVVIYGL